MGTAESLLYYDEGQGGDVEGGESESGVIGSGGPSASASNRPAPSPSFTTGGIAASGPLHSSRQRQSIDEARQQRGGENKNEQSPPLTLRGYVIGSSSTGKTSLVRRLRGENPFVEDDDVPGAAAAEQQRKRRPQRKRKMMALVPWKDRQSGQNCQLHVVEKPCGSLAAGGEADGVEANAHDVALEALGDRPDFCICMVDPRSDSSVEFAKTAIDALLNASLADRPSSSRRTTTSITNSSNSSNNLTPLNRPNICVLINYMDLVKVVDEEGDDGDNDDGLYHITQSRLMDVCADIIDLQTSGEGGTSKYARTTIAPSIQVYPSSMVSCSGLTSLHSFIMLPYMRKKEVRLLQELELLHRSHNKSMADLRDGGVKAMQQAIDEGRARMSTAPPANSGRRSIIQRQRGRGIVGTSGASATAGWEKRVRIDETRNTNHFEGDEPLPSQSKSTPSVRHDDIDGMTQRLQEADQVRRLRRQQALDGKMASEEGQEKRSFGKQASSGSSRRSIISSKQRSAMQETISKIPVTSEQIRTKKQSKEIAADPMRALEDFLGSDSDSDLDGGDPIRSGGRGESAAENGESDNDNSSTGNNSSSDSDGGGDPRPSILLSDSDSEDDDFYYDEGGHAHYSHLDDRKKPSAQKQQVDEDFASKQTEPAKEISVVNDNMETPPKSRDSKILRSSNHCEEEKKDESPIGKPAADEESSPDASLPVDEEEVIGRQEILDSEDEASVSKPNVDAKSIEERVEQMKKEVVDSEGESAERAELARPKILDSDDDDSVEKGPSEDSSPAVEILHSDDEDDETHSPHSRVEILHSDDEESNRDLGSKGSESPGNEVQVLDSDDESNPSVADRPADILHSDDDGDDGVYSLSPASPRVSPPERPPVAPVADDSGDDERESSRVEILYSDEEEDDAVPPTPSTAVVRKSIDSDEEEHDHQTIEIEQVAPSIDDASDSEPPVVSSSSNVLVEALQPNDTDDEPEIESEAVTEESASTGMSAAVAAALAAAEEEARRMMEATVPPSSGGEEKRRKKKKKTKDGKRSKKSSSSKIADGGEEKKAKKKSRKSTSRSVEDS